jgi:hypothetical protein
VDLGDLDPDPDPDPDPQHYSYVHIHKQRIFKIQKKAIRIVTGSLYNAHTAPLFTQHNILPYVKLITFSQLMFMHSIEYNYSPSSFENIWLQNNHRDLDRALRNANEYILPQPRTETFKFIIEQFIELLYNYHVYAVSSSPVLCARLPPPLSGVSPVGCPCGYCRSPPLIVLYILLNYALVF